MMSIDHRKGFKCQEESDEGLTLETSVFNSLRWPIYVINLVDNSKLPWFTIAQLDLGRLTVYANDHVMRWLKPS